MTKETETETEDRERERDDGISQRSQPEEIDVLLVVCRIMYRHENTGRHCHVCGCQTCGSKAMVLKMAETLAGRQKTARYDWYACVCRRCADATKRVIIQGGSCHEDQRKCCVTTSQTTRMPTETRLCTYSEHNEHERRDGDRPTHTHTRTHAHRPGRAISASLSFKNCSSHGKRAAMIAVNVPEPKEQRERESKQRE